MAQVKRNWEHPTATVQLFTPSEYVAACWKIKCNVPRGIGFYDTNGDKKYQAGIDQEIARGTGCGIWHTGIQGDPNDEPYANAMWQPTRGGIFGEKPVGEPYAVYYWTQENSGWGKSDHHFSKVSDAEWETNPNAS